MLAPGKVVFTKWDKAYGYKSISQMHSGTYTGDIHSEVTHHDNVSMIVSNVGMLLFAVSENDIGWLRSESFNQPSTEA